MRKKTLFNSKKWVLHQEVKLWTKRQLANACMRYWQCTRMCKICHDQNIYAETSHNSNVITIFNSCTDFNNIALDPCTATNVACIAVLLRWLHSGVLFPRFWIRLMCLTLFRRLIGLIHKTRSKRVSTSKRVHVILSFILTYIKSTSTLPTWILATDTWFCALLIHTLTRLWEGRCYWYDNICRPVFNDKFFFVYAIDIWCWYV